MVGFLKSVAGAQNSLANVGTSGAGDDRARVVDAGFAPDPGSPYTTTFDMTTLDYEAGDLLIAVIIAESFYDATDTTITTSGWSEIFRFSSSGGGAVFTRIADGSETNVIATETRSGGVFVVALRGFDTPTKAEHVLESASSGRNLTIPAMTDTDFDVFLHVFYQSGASVAIMPTAEIPGRFEGKVFASGSFAVNSPIAGVFFSPDAGNAYAARNRGGNNGSLRLIRCGLNRSA